MKTEGGCVRRVFLNHEFAKAMFSNPNFIKVDMPRYAEFVDAYRDDARQGWWFIYEDEIWDAISEGEEIPEVEFDFEVVRCLDCGKETFHDKDRDENYCPECERIFPVI